MSSSIPRFLLYGLYDPRTNELRYIGRTVDLPSRRIYHHILDAKTKGKDFSEHNAWVCELLSEGMRPDIRVIEECNTRQDMYRREKELIRDFSIKGARLTNKMYNPNSKLRDTRASQFDVYLGFTNPTGDPIVITDLIGYCEIHGLDSDAMRKVYLGRQGVHRGYSHVNNAVPVSDTYKVWSGFVRPDGALEPPFNALDRFCKERGLARSRMQELAKGKCKSYRGWTHIGIE